MTIAGVALADLLDAETSTELFPFAQIISILNEGFIWKMPRNDKSSSEKEFAERILMRLQKAVRD